MSRLSSFHELIWSFSAVLWLSRYINTVSENPSLVPRLCQVNAYIHKHATNYRERLCAVLCLVTQSCPTLCDPMDCSPPGSSVRGDSPGKNTGVGCHALLQGIFPTQGLNSGLPHCRWILYCLSLQGSPRILEWVAYPFSSRSSWSGFLTRWATREAHKGHFSPLKTSLKVSRFMQHGCTCHDF